jgi:hypothetical protein
MATRGIWLFVIGRRTLTSDLGGNGVKTLACVCIQRVYTLVPDISEAPRGRARQSRALFALGGKIAYYIFGVATDSSVDEMRKAIADLQLVAQTSLGDAAKTRSVMADYTPLD